MYTKSKTCIGKKKDDVFELALPEKKLSKNKNHEWESEIISQKSSSSKELVSAVRPEVLP